MLRLNFGFSNESLWGRWYRCTLLHQKALYYKADFLLRVAVHFCQWGADHLVKEDSLWAYDI